MSEKSSVRKEIALIAGPREWGDTRDSWLARAARRVPTVSFRTMRSLWYGEIRNPNHWALRDIRRAAAERGRNESGLLADQFETIAHGLSVTDADFHSDTIAALVSAARALRNLDRA